MTRQERLLRLARLRGDRAAELIVQSRRPIIGYDTVTIGGVTYRDSYVRWTEAELRAAWGDR